MHIFKKPLFLCISGLVACQSLFAQATGAEEIVIKATGTFKKISDNIAPSKAIMDALKSSSQSERDKAVKEIEAHPGNYIPPVFFLLSQVLFNEDKKDMAAFWFYFGQLRGRYDANRCADISARSGMGVLNQNFGPQINKYAFANLSFLEALIPKVMELDAAVPHNYDQRWINLHGMGAVLGEDEEGRISLPEKLWPQILADTRKDYLRGFNEAMAEMKKLK